MTDTIKGCPFRSNAQLTTIYQPISGYSLILINSSCNRTDMRFLPALLLISSSSVLQKAKPIVNARSRDT